MIISLAGGHFQQKIAAQAGKTVVIRREREDDDGIINQRKNDIGQYNIFQAV